MSGVSRFSWRLAGWEPLVGEAGEGAAHEARISLKLSAASSGHRSGAIFVNWC